MAKMTCARCGKEWNEPGFPGTTICDDCLREHQADLTNDNGFKETVLKILTEEEVELLKNVDWNELKIIAAEYVALQLRWKIIKVRGDR
ncbi:hypothetical protein EDD68_107106 [Melghiribacillus thermohalophilus]|uniref:Uncharacterized protein n=1 Tax=Melghiribacillus thermohalophilus TaxID=1324956 RepID=A0A4V2V221_9BACI|nr:hypothetical protein [Melghiribacillus thermohalophilus]TCT23392.1 hypothetical protein EDD68_107106 [Melghiribacillus thermohalophilus]